MRLAFIGPPGVGKGTQAARLAQTLDVPHLSTGEMFRDAAARKTKVGLLAEGLMKAGRLVPDDIVISLVQERLNAADCKPGFLLDGFPRTVPQARELDRMLSDRGTPLQAVVALFADPQRLFARMLARGRIDDNAETIRERNEQYEACTAPLLDYYQDLGLLEAVDSNGSIEEVAALVEQALAGEK